MIAKRITAGAVCLAMTAALLPAAAAADDDVIADSFAYYEEYEEYEASEQLDNESLESAPDRVGNFRYGKVTEHGYTLAWDKVKGADGYRLYRFDKRTKKYRRVKTLKRNRIRIKGLDAGQKNTYRVTAFKREDGKINEGKAAVGKFTTKPAKVELCKIKQRSKGYVTLRWRRVKNASAYNVYYAADGGKYKLLKTVSGKKGELKTGLLPTGKRIKIKIRAVSKVGSSIQLGGASPAIATMVFNKLTVDEIMDSYNNSVSVTQVNPQGFKLSDSNRSTLSYHLNRLGGSAGYMLYDIDSGSAVAYNADTYFNTASTVKMPYILYSLRCMEDGDPPMDKLLTYLPSDYSGGSSWISTQPFYSQYTIKRVMELISEYSDNCGYYMLQDEFGYTGYNKFIKKLGCKPSVNPQSRWGYVSSCDSTREWACMWRYMHKGRYKDFAKSIFSTTCGANIRAQLGNRYTVYEKSGWTGEVYNETSLVAAKHPYIVICLTTVTDAARMRDVAEISETIHNNMWNYYNK
ncbi:MAG: serine hydrolase [Ruminococcus sp.]|nr:serine hydrolase [Ruminococcus sp.]